MTFHTATDFHWAQWFLSGAAVGDFFSGRCPASNSSRMGHMFRSFRTAGLQPAAGTAAIASACLTSVHASILWHMYSSRNGRCNRASAALRLQLSLCSIPKLYSCRR